VESVEYNTQRDHLLIAEYGRNVQKMIQHALTIDDREKRTRFANTIVNVMGYLNPQLRDTVDYKHKLWDHLFLISGYKLDVDAPYPIPGPDSGRLKPAHIGYPSSDIVYKYYGKTMEDMIRRVSEMEDGPSKEQYARYLANYMKMSYLTWNKDTVDDNTILNHLEELSEGRLKLSETARLNHTSEMLAMGKEKMRENSTKINKHKRNKKRNKK
ncbi:MAG: DUF4290 domain-containing protein, partial [Flavobacteriales bacterium]